jgi:hypothetical protein
MREGVRRRGYMSIGDDQMGKKGKKEMGSVLLWMNCPPHHDTENT